ncbi:MAG: LysM peptidoglycan-binding domain-containing protein [Opitutaceae bacterium]
MEDDINASSSSMVPVALAVLAIALGGAGLYFGITANQQLSPISDSMEANSGSAARIEKQLSAFDTKLTELTAKNNELAQTVSRLRVYSSQSEQAVKQALSGVKSNREEMVKLVEKVNEFTAGVTRPKPAPAKPAAVDTASGTVTVTSGETAATGSAASTYSIQSGDNFAKIAGKLGISLQALLDANPGVNPRALQIGQKIAIPAN